MDKDKLIKEIYKGIKSAANKRAVNKPEAEDFLQEGITAALDVINKYSDKPYEEQIKLISRVALNRILKAQRTEINWNRRVLKKSKKDERPIDNWDLEEGIDIENSGQEDFSYGAFEERRFIAMARSFLSDMGQKILSERLNPSKNTIKIMEIIKLDKLKQRESGKLVMNVHNDKISDTHIAKSLGISKATMSREIKRIQEVVSYLKYGLEELNCHE